MHRAYGDWGDFSLFPQGTRVRVKREVVDFNAFDGDTGIVVENSGEYLGVIVKFDIPRQYVDMVSNQPTHVMTEFNFNPCHLDIIDPHAGLRRYFDSTFADD